MGILVIGANGQLGWELCSKAKKHDLDIEPLDLPEFDIADPSAINTKITPFDISLIINASAYTAVDQAESKQEIAFAVNRDGPARLSSYCAKHTIPLIHISTDYVFDGSKKGPYLENDPVAPLGVYGKSKAAGETEVRNLREHIIVRTAWLYGLHGNNFVKTMLRLGKNTEILRVVADQYGCPTYAADLAEAVLTIASKIIEGGSIAWGTYHYCGKGRTSWHGFAEKIFELAKKYDSLKVKNVVPITTKDYPTPAKRPANSVLECSLITKQFGIMPRDWQESLAKMIKTYYQSMDVN
ncbi:MAG TPA: dTDP-4-dehydrorhamnose reductase [Desulfatiglandales bacterium]|nr:dTDP-4-dehydrorhamnose reductase [Desulfatiglandales bacterium]